MYSPQSDILAPSQMTTACPGKGFMVPSINRTHWHVSNENPEGWLSMLSGKCSLWDLVSSCSAESVLSWLLYRRILTRNLVNNFCGRVIMAGALFLKLLWHYFPKVETECSELPTAWNSLTCDENSTELWKDWPHLWVSGYFSGAQPIN